MLLCEASVSLEGGVAVRRLPGGHEATSGDVADSVRAAKDVFVREKTEGARFSRAVARGALGEDERGDVAGEGGLRGLVLDAPDGEEERGGDEEGGNERQESSRQHRERGRR